MRERIRSHLTYANVVATLALVLVIAGGTAAAVTYVVSSNSQVGPGTISGHKPPSGKHANIIAGSINGKDIADRSGVDTCPTPLTIKRGAICAGSSGSKNWRQAIDYCSSYGLRLPSFSEAEALARNYDVPGVPAASPQGGPYFWTDGFWEDPSGRAYGVDENGGTLNDFASDSNITVCVTDPSA
jgi:hypothetical protein